MREYLLPMILIHPPMKKVMRSTGRVIMLEIELEVSLEKPALIN